MLQFDEGTTDDLGSSEAQSHLSQRQFVIVSQEFKKSALSRATEGTQFLKKKHTFSNASTCGNTKGSGASLMNIKGSGASLFGMQHQNLRATMPT